MKYSPKYKLLLAIFICLWHTAILWTSAESYYDDYSDQFRNKLMVPFRQIKTNSKNCKVNVLMQLKPDGNVARLAVKGNPPQPELEKQVYALIVNSQPFSPPPPALLAKSYVYMYFNWSETYTKGYPYPSHDHAISGPYFFEKPPKSICDEVGLSAQSFEDIITSKMVHTVQNLDNLPIAGETTVSRTGKIVTSPYGNISTTAYVKFKPNGTIEKVAFRSSPKNIRADELVRNGLTSAQPFGTLPQAALTAPYYKIRIDWVVLSKASGTLAPGLSCQHLESIPEELKK